MILLVNYFRTFDRVEELGGIVAGKVRPTVIV